MSNFAEYKWDDLSFANIRCIYERGLMDFVLSAINNCKNFDDISKYAFVRVLKTICLLVQIDTSIRTDDIKKYIGNMLAKGLWWDHIHDAAYKYLDISFSPDQLLDAGSDVSQRISTYEKWAEELRKDGRAFNIDDQSQLTDWAFCELYNFLSPTPVSQQLI